MSVTLKDYLKALKTIARFRKKIDRSISKDIQNLTENPMHEVIGLKSGIFSDTKITRGKIYKLEIHSDGTLIFYDDWNEYVDWIGELLYKGVIEYKK